MTGRICKIIEDTITINQEDAVTCFGCMHQECKSRQWLIMAKNPLKLPLSIGQIVEIEIPRTAFLSQTLQILLLLIFGFLGGFILTGILFPNSGDPPRAAGGVLLLFIAACITYWVRKRFPPRTILQVTRVCDTTIPNCKEQLDRSRGNLDSPNTLN